MARTGYIVALISMIMGVALVAVTLIRQGVVLSIGVLFGTLLIANAVVRLWIIRRSGSHG